MIDYTPILMTQLAIDNEFILSLVAILSGIGGAVLVLSKIFGSNIDDEKKLRDSDTVKDIHTKSKTIEAELKVTDAKIHDLKDLITAQYVEVEKLKIITTNSHHNIDELKQQNRDLVQRLDDLLKQIMEYVD